MDPAILAHPGRTGQGRKVLYKESSPRPQLFASPFAHGHRVVHYFGPVVVETFVGDPCDRPSAWLQAEIDLLAAMERKAFMLGANAVVGLLVDLDPWAVQRGRSGLSLRAEGTGALLEPISWP